MARDLRNHIRKCGCCKKFEAAPPIAPLKPLACSGPGELLHVDFTSIEETVPLHQEPVIRNVMVMQDHFSKYVIAYVVKDQTARTAAETLRNGYFGLFGAPAYLVSDQGKLLHVDFTSIEETVPLHQEPVIRNVMVMQDHFSKYVIAYVVKDQTARTAAETLRNGYFGLFGAPAYLVSDQGKAFTGHLISNLCELYGVQKLRTLPYHAQTNGQVERMNQTIIRMIGKLEQDKKGPLV